MFDGEMFEFIRDLTNNCVKAIDIFCKRKGISQTGLYYFFIKYNEIIYDELKETEDRGDNG